MKKLLSIIFALTLITGFTSCLKERAEIGDKPQNIIEFYTTDGYLSTVRAIYPVYGKNFVTGQKGTFDVTVSYSGTEVAPQDIKLGIAVDAEALAKFNAAAPTTGDDTYLPLVASAYSVPTEVTIKKGERRAVFQVEVTLPLTFNFDENYALPLSIKSTTTGIISGNFGSVLYRIGGKNQYDGDYKSTGVRVHPDLGPFTFDAIVTMNTAGSTSIVGNALADLGPNLKIVVNPDNSVSLSSTAQPSVALTPGGVNKYDPATKTFTLTYFYNTGAPRKITQTLVKQ
jgi:hypothetical protein